MPQMIRHFAAWPGVQFWVPTLLTTPSLCIALFSTAAGWLGDRFGRRNLLIRAIFVYVVAGMAPIFLDNMFTILATRVAVGLCEAFVLTLSTALIGDFFAGHEREKWLAAQTAVASISAIAMLLIGGVLGSLFGWRGPFGIYFCTILLGLALIRYTWEPVQPPSDQRNSGSWAQFPFRIMAGICAITLVAATLFSTMQVQMSSALALLGVGDPSRAGLYTALASIGVPVGTVVFWRCAAWNVLRLLAVEFTIMGLSFAAMSHLGTITGFTAACFFNQLGAGMILPTLLTWAVRQLPFEIRGRGTGLWQSVFSAGQFASGLAAPAIAQHGGGLLGAFQYLGLLSIATGAVVLALPAEAQGVARSEGGQHGLHGFP
jgi:MFS family permease